jgi:hypothetical protein
MIRCGNPHSRLVKKPKQTLGLSFTHTVDSPLRTIGKERKNAHRRQVDVGRGAIDAIHQRQLFIFLAEVFHDLKFIIWRNQEPGSSPSA